MQVAERAREQAPTLALRRLRSPYGEAWEEISCPGCAGVRSTLWLQAQDRLFGAPDTYRIVRCTDCDLVFVNPRPTFETLESHYQDQYLAFVTPEESPWYLRPFVKRWGRSTLRRRIREMESCFGRMTPDTQILDVGCGLNDLLLMIKETRGATGLGIDLNAKAVEYIRDKLHMPAIRGTLENARLESSRFDVVTMMHYLEHEGHPRRVLAEARRVLKPGGHLAIEIPDATGWPPRFFKDRWGSLDLPRHLVFFREQTLRRTLAEEGFELLSYRTFGVPFWTGISVLFALQRHNHVENPFMAAVISTLLGAPFLPFLPWTREFGFAVARASRD